MQVCVCEPFLTAHAVNKVLYVTSVGRKSGEKYEVSEREIASARERESDQSRKKTLTVLLHFFQQNQCFLYLLCLYGACVR